MRYQRRSTETIEAIDDEPFLASIGKTIASLVLEQDEIRMRFSDGTGIGIRDNDGQCCEHRFVSTDDTLADYVGAVLLGGELRPAPGCPIEPKSSDHGCDVQFLAVSTSKGDFVMSTHNEHNGYYSGFQIETRYLDPEQA